ncbi:MAG TPA: class I SAM-dependent methyltransferase [Candidatus Sulfotelmatobacter sp.]|nr:class I SAM-dependent methyltransferase [Candidatus Sulfotelmatobacter sp.]
MKRPAGRAVEPELLDELPPNDPRALRSRRDLRLLNLGMGHPPIMARALLEHLRGRNAPRIVELGAGDGHFLLSVANRLRQQWPSAEVTLVDRLDSFDPEIKARFNDLGWHVHTEIKTATEWLRQASAGGADAIVFNLFLHQFRDEELTEMLGLAARTTNLLVALEPRRSWLAKLSGRLLWVIGCGPVTRHDAEISVRAGFCGNELCAIWPNKIDWSLIERPAGLFSHLFIARRANP